jgi:hypothetical protein
MSKRISAPDIPERGWIGKRQVIICKGLTEGPEDMEQACRSTRRRVVASSIATHDAQPDDLVSHTKSMHHQWRRTKRTLSS